MISKNLQLLIDQYWKIYNSTNDKDSMSILWTYIEATLKDNSISKLEFAQIKKEVSETRLEYEKIQNQRHDKEIELPHIIEKYGKKYVNDVVKELNNIGNLAFKHPRYVGFILLTSGRKGVDLINSIHPTKQQEGNGK